MDKQKWYQQGDVIIEPSQGLPGDAKKVERRNGQFVLAEGELTGHKHAIEDIGGMECVEKDGMFYFTNKKTVTVKHEEHKTQVIPPGTWQVRGVKEYDHFLEEARLVQD